MSEVQWGDDDHGLRFGLRLPPGDVEAGGTIGLELLCENRSSEPVAIFGFQKGYPRALRVSPPKSHRPWIRVSWGDLNVLHPPDAFVRLLPGSVVSTALDLSFAFDRRGAGVWPIAFAYDTVRASGRLAPFVPHERVEASTAIVNLTVTLARSLREAGIDDDTEAQLDLALLTADPGLIDRLRLYGEGGAAFAARRIARILSSGAETATGWRALDAITLLGDSGLRAVGEARQQIPHAETALRFAEEWIRHRRGEPPPQPHLPFLTTLDRIIEQPDSRGNFLLTWTAVDSDIHGTRRLQIFGNGERIVTGRAPRSPNVSTRRSNLTRMQMQTLVEALRYAAVWLLRPLREVGLPDEPRPSLEVQLALGEPFSRNVAMWNGEWRLGPASPLADLLDRLSQDAAPHSMPAPA